VIGPSGDRVIAKCGMRLDSCNAPGSLYVKNYCRERERRRQPEGKRGTDLKAVALWNPRKTHKTQGNMAFGQPVHGHP